MTALLLAVACVWLCGCVHGLRSECCCELLDRCAETVSKAV